MFDTNILKVVLLVGCVVGFSHTAEAQRSWAPGDTGSIRFRLGLFQPEGDSSYWDEKFEVWTGDTDGFQDLVWAIDGLWMIAPSWGFQVGTSWYQGSTGQSYRDWVDDSGNEIWHTTELETWDVTFACLFRPLRGSTVRPYFGIGGGLLSWRLIEYGDFIDFSPEGDGAVVYGTYKDDGATFMAIGVAGLEFFSPNGWSLIFEGRWREADTSLGGGFSSLQQTLDLSGPEFSAGISWNF